MKKTIGTAVTAMMLSIGIAGSSIAEPDGSQHLRGIGGRIFLVDVEVISSLVPELPVGTKFPNCYIFDNGGVWIDPGFPVPGTWMQHSTGAATPYTAFADADGLAILQEGYVTPAMGGGALQLDALSTVLIGELKLAEFASVGAEVDTCPL